VELAGVVSRWDIMRATDAHLVLQVGLFMQGLLHPDLGEVIPLSQRGEPDTGTDLEMTNDG
jgi:hypothetical protein